MSLSRLVVLLAGVMAADGAVAQCGGSLFAPPVRYASSTDGALLLADLDGDDRPEILTSGDQVEQSAAISVLRNRGDGTFEAERQSASGFGDRIEGVSDLDGDGRPELLVSDYWANGIAVIHGSGALQFDGRVAYATATHGGPSRFVDYDGDGVTDIASFSFGSANPVRMHLLRGRGNRTFDAKKTFETSLTVAASPSMRTRDGVLEFLAGNHSGQLAVLRLAGDGVAVSTLPAGPGYDLTSVFADVNGDGLADIVDTNDGGDDADTNPFEWIFVTLAKPDGTFVERRQLMRTRKVKFPVAVAAADFDGDGRNDLVAGDFRSTTLHWFRGDGAGGFAEGVAVDAGGPVNDLVTADVNGDGRLDIVTINNDRSVSVIVNERCLVPRRRSARH